MTQLTRKQLRGIPVCLTSGWEDCRNLSELLHFAQTEVDLSNEGQDGAITQREAQIVKRWIKKHKEVPA